MSAYFVGMKKLLLVAAVMMFYYPAKSQFKPQNENFIFLKNISLGFEIGSNYLDVENLNCELIALDALAINPNTNNFTFQMAADINPLEVYVSLMLINSYTLSRVIDSDLLFRSTRFHGNYIAAGIRRKLFSVFRERLSMAASADFGNAHYYMTLSRANIIDTSIDALLMSSNAVIADNNYVKVIQPGLEILYAVMMKKNQLDIGLRLGYLYQLEEKEWQNQHQVIIQGLSPIGNKYAYNFALKFLYTFDMKADR